MSSKPTFLPVLLIILIINAAGFFLRYFGLDTYFILIGFRFHFSLFISFLFILNYIDFNSVKEMFIHPSKQRFVFILLLSFLPLLFIPIDLYILKQFKVAEQDYFFELGISSIVDYPVYLIWNAPQLFMFFIFMNTVLISPKYKFIKASLVTLFLFLYEIVPLDAAINYSKINYFVVASFFFAFLLSGLFISLIKNIYLFAVVLFTVLWVTILAFGSSSETIVNILLASQYESWGGFIKLNKKFEFAQYLQPAYLFLIIIFSILILKKNKIRSAS
ncbi:MAG: hypothetical protein Q7S39_08520 [Ignavibacteria bacterium]|nr:hypothetical protein [Ignavibacteria bacterium]